MDADTIKRLLQLSPLTFEGGFFRETYRSEIQFRAEHLPDRYGSARSAGTAIYYLLDDTTFSGMHRLKSAETYHFYQGDPVQLLMLHPDGTGETVILGSSLADGHLPQHTVPEGVWQGSHLLARGRFALMGTTMYPGFDRDDFEGGERRGLQRQYPDYAELIARLTRV